MKKLICMTLLLLSCAKAPSKELDIVFADDIVFDQDQIIVCTFVKEANGMACTSIEEFMVRAEVIRNETN